MSRSPCVRCGLLLHTGEGRVLVAFSVAELSELAVGAADKNVRERLLCALGLLDQDEERMARATLADAGIG